MHSNFTMSHWINRVATAFSSSCVTTKKHGYFSLDEKFSKGFLIMMFLIGFTVQSSFAQVSGYSFAQSTDTYAQITGTTSTATGDDGTQTNISIGFTFNFGGTDYTAFGISTNGIIRLGSSSISSGWTNSLGNSATLRPLITPFWDDNNLSTGTIRYTTTGTAPNRILTVNWHNFKAGGGGSTGGASVSMLLRLYETTNVIEFVYGSPFTTSNSVSASVGINDSTSFLSVTPAATSTVSSSTANNSINASAMANLAGKKLTFTPPAPPACALPSSLIASAVTSDSATISWTAPASAPSNGYEYEVRTSGLPGTGGASALGSPAAGITTANVTALASNTTYSFYVRSNCGGDGYSDWSGAGTFTTLCDAETAPTTTQTFATFTGSAPNPSCWSEATGAVANPSTLTTANSEWFNGNFANTGSNTGVKTNLYSTNPGEWIISQPIDLGGTAGLYRVKYNMAVTSYNGTTAQATLGTHIVRVIVSTDGGSTWNLSNTIKTYTGAGTYSNTGQIETVNLTGFSGVVKIAFVSTTSSTSPDIDFHIDDFEVEAIPNCIEPTDVLASLITSDTATISWTAPESAPASGYEYEVRTSGAAGSGATGLVDSGLNSAGDVDADITGLTAATTYSFYVRSNCGEDDDVFSYWSGAGTFTTLKAEPTNQVTNFAAGTVTTTAIPFTWTAAVAGAQAPDGYLIKASDVSLVSITDPVDGTDIANVTVFTAGAANKKQTTGASTSSTSFTGMTAGTMYYYKNYAYTNSGTGIDFNTVNPAEFYHATLPSANTAFVFAASSATEATLSWTQPGTYDNTKHTTLVFVKAATAVTAGTPSSAASAYTASTTFGSGTPFVNDTSAFCVFNGDGNSVDITSLEANTQYHVLVYVVMELANSNGTSSYSTGLSASGFSLCEPEDVTPVAGFRCGPGEVELTATATGGADIGWYADATGGVALGSGETFTTDVITENTTFYVQAETSISGIEVLGAGGSNSSTVGQSFLPGAWGGAKTQYIIRASELEAIGLLPGDITSLGFEPTNAGQTYQGFFVNIGQTAETVAPSGTFISTGLTQVYAGTEANDGFLPVANTVNTLNFGTGSGSASTFTWDGTSNIVVSISWSRVPGASTASSTTMKVDNVGFTCSSRRQRDNLTPAAMLAETSVAGTTTFRPRFTINGQVICASPREAVLAEIGSAPALTLSAAPAAVCAGEDTTSVTITSVVSDFDTYEWSPALGVTGNETTGWTFNTSETTEYTLTASNSGTGCSNIATVTISILPTPPTITIDNADATICSNEIQTLTVTGGQVEDAEFNADSGVISAAIPDNSLTTGVVSNLVVSGVPASATITTIEIGLNITHAWNSDMRINLEGPNGEIINLVNQVAGSGVNFVDLTITSDNTAATLPTSNTTNLTGTYKASLANQATIATTPAVSSTSFSDLFDTPNGTWKLRVYDDANSDTGTVTNWSIKIIYNFGEVLWSPTTGLFTDDLATVPYNGVDHALTLYANPSADITYTATATGDCGSSDTVSFVVDTAPTTADAGTSDTYIDGDVITLGANNPAVGTGAWTVFSGPSTDVAQFGNAAVHNTSFNHNGGMGTYVLRWTISNGVCTASMSDVSITIEPVKWSGGAWNNVTGPTALLEAEIDGDYVSADDGSSITVKNLTITATSTLTISSGDVLTVAGALINEATVNDVVIESGAYLHQTSNDANTGSITIKRAASIKRLDISLWSSPVAAQNLLALSPQTLTNRFFGYSEVDNNWVIIPDVANEVMVPAAGYGVRAPNNWAVTLTTFTGEFKGVPNNGDYTQAFTSDHATANYNLIGNPYPSVLDLRAFYTANTGKILNTIYFFEHTITPGTGGGQTNYGTLTIAPDAVDNVYVPASSSPNLPNIAAIQAAEAVEVGQGFFVRAVPGESGNLDFNNAMRKTTPGVFFRNATTTVDSENEVTSKFRLQMTSPEGFVNQTVVGYYDYASNDLDMMDAQGIGSPLYTILSSKKLASQGFGLPFNQGQVIPLGGNFEIAGEYSIALHSGQGIFETSQYVLIHDNVLGIYHNLSLSPYSFEASGGINDTRFEIVFTSVLSSENPLFAGNSVVVYEINDVLQAQVKGNTLLESIQVVDLSGKILFEQSGINANLYNLNTIRKTETILLVTTTTIEGLKQTHKIFY